jgi:hypothetical protein
VQACPTSPAHAAPTYNGAALAALCANLFVEASATTAQRNQLMQDVASGIDRNRQFYGSLQLTLPDIVVCVSNGCIDYFAGPEGRNRVLGTGQSTGGYVAPRTTIVIVNVANPNNPRVLAHELSHIETAARLGGRSVPTWFDEGVATFLGGEPGCAGVPTNAIADLTQLSSPAAWNAYVTANNQALLYPTYCQARLELLRWTAARGGSAAVVDLLAGMRAGGSFGTLYGPLQTQ